MNSKIVQVGDAVVSKIVCISIFFAAFLFYLFFSHLLLITDPVESNYALTAKEMVLTSDWLSPRIYGNVWFDKPVFFYWLIAIAFKIFGFSDIVARLAPATFAALGLVLIYWFMTKVAKQSVALLAMLVMGTSLEYVVLAKLIITDMVFFVFNSTALIYFYLGYIKMGGTKRWYLLMYASLALAVLTKGPVGVLLPGLVMIIFIGVQRNWAELKEMSIFIGIILFLFIALPWYMAMYVTHGTEFINTFLGIHNYLRATVSEHPKDNVSYYCFVVFLLSMLPWSFVALKAIVIGYKEGQNSPLVVTFSFIWVLVYFGFYSFMATKYVTYTFPILFPASIITAFYIEKLLVQNKTRSILSWIGVPFATLIIAYIILSFRFFHDTRLVAAVSSFLLILLFTCWQAKSYDAKRVFRVLCLCQIACYIILSVLVFPEITESRSGKGIADIIIADKNDYRVGMYQFYSTSSVYYSDNIAVSFSQRV
jgi:4-amino-4-deoxy-L-arabinose transferase-like glycosyltransferase